jgi:hypothetical protein
MAKQYSEAAPPYSVVGLGLSIPEKHWTSVSLHTPLTPPPPRPRHELHSLAISRSRIVLRLISLILTTTILGLMGSTYASFFATRGHKLIYAGESIWPDDIDLTTSNCVIAVAAISATLSALALAIGLWPRWRHVTREGDALAAAVAAANFVGALVAAVVQSVYRGRNVRLEEWTCAHPLVEHPQAEFEDMCSGLVISARMGCGVVVVEVLGLVLVLVGCVVVRRKREKKLGLGALRV